jgi:hypothetical protein
MMHTRLSALFLVALCTLAGPTVAWAAGDGAQEAEPVSRQVAGVEVELRSKEASIAKWTQSVDFGAAADLSLAADGHAHAVRVSVTKLDEAGTKLRVQLGYERDGTSMLETMTVDAKANERKTVRSADGDVSIALRVAPKSIPAQEAPTPRHIDLALDTTDPLAGV